MSKLPDSLQQSAAGIQLLALDVDGVLTDGRIYYTNEGDEMKAFNDNVYIPDVIAISSFYKNWNGPAYYRGAMDMLTCDGIHAVDTLRYLCGGEVESVAADNRRLDAGHWNVHLALVRFSSGATGVLLNNFMAGRRIFSVEIHAAGISFFGDPEEGGRLYADNQLEPVETLDPFELAGSDESHRAFGAWDTHEHFLQSIRNNQPPETNFDDAVKTMELVDAVYGGQI